MCFAPGPYDEKNINNTTQTGIAVLNHIQLKLI